MTTKSTRSRWRTTPSTDCTPTYSRGRPHAPIGSRRALSPAACSSTVYMMSPWRRSVDSSSPAWGANSAFLDSSNIWNLKPCSAMATRSDQSLLAELLLAVRQLYERARPDVDDLPTGLPWLSLVRRAMPTAVGRGMLQPSVCLMVQGGKESLVGRPFRRYGPGDYVQAAMPIPVSGRIVRASGAEPYYGIRIDLDPKEVAEFILQIELPVPPVPDDAPVVTVEAAADLLLEAFLRLLRLLNRARERDLAVLGRLLKQEITYHLVTASGGIALTRGILRGKREQAVGRAISWI